MKLTPDQLRQAADAMDAHAAGKPVEFRQEGSDTWTTAKGTDTLSWDLKYTHYRPKPEPVVRPWSKPEDVPGPVCWVRTKHQPELHMMVTAIWPAGVACNDSRRVSYREWDDLSGCEHSTDRKTWLPCTVTESN